MGKHWTKEELKYIKKNCGILKDEVIACKLLQLTGRVCTGNAVRQIRAKLGIKKEHGRGVCRLVAKKPKIKKIRTFDENGKFKWVVPDGG